jgi:tRNA(fMet)-specific endonuclease VapC
VQNPGLNLALVHTFSAPIRSLPFDNQAADEYAQIRVGLEKRGQPIGPNDTMIAAIAVTNGLTLVTHNSAEFSRVTGLKLDDWHT